MTRMLLEFLEFILYWLVGGQIVLLLGLLLFAYFLSRSKKYKEEIRRVINNEEYWSYYDYYGLTDNKIKGCINQFVFWPIHLFLYCKYTWDIVTKGSD